MAGFDTIRCSPVATQSMMLHIPNSVVIDCVQIKIKLHPYQLTCHSVCPVLVVLGVVVISALLVMMDGCSCAGDNEIQ